VESFARHFMQVLDTWSHDGAEAVMARWRRYGGREKQGLPTAAPSWLVDGEIAA